MNGDAGRLLGRTPPPALPLKGRRSVAALRRDEGEQRLLIGIAGAVGIDMALEPSCSPG